MSTLIINTNDLTEADVKAVVDLIGNIKANKVKTRWRAERGEKYNYIDDQGTINWSIEDNTAKDAYRYKTGNYYKTVKEADFERNKKLITQELEDYAMAHNEGAIEWTDLCQAKHYFCYEYINNEFAFGVTYGNKRLNCTHFTSFEITKAAIKSVGEDRIKKYLFGVE